MSSTSSSWLGSIAMTAGNGVFLGRSGNNKPHKHWAHQLAIGTETNYPTDYLKQLKQSFKNLDN